MAAAEELAAARARWEAAKEFYLAGKARRFPAETLEPARVAAEGLRLE